MRPDHQLLRWHCITPGHHHSLDCASML
jgi:hypothetical protein